MGGSAVNLVRCVFLTARFLEGLPKCLVLIVPDRLRQVRPPACYHGRGLGLTVRILRSPHRGPKDVVGPFNSVSAQSTSQNFCEGGRIQVISCTLS